MQLCSLHPSHFPPAFFLPAGSFSSRHNSTLNSETDREEVTPTHAADKADDSDIKFVPSRANLIVFEAATPAVSSRDHSEIGRDGEMEMEEMLWEEHGDVGKLAKTYAPHCTELNLQSLGKSLKTMQSGTFRSLLEGGDISAIPEANDEASHLETIDSTSSRRPEGLLQELEELRRNCQRYESQNEALRKELQSCTGDIKSLDKFKRKAMLENTHLRSLVADYQTIYGKLSEIADKLAGTLGTTAGETKSEDLHHVVNHIQSQVEIICSRHNRIQAMHDHLTDSTKKMTKDIETLKKSLSTSQETIDRLSTTLRSKESLIEKLEDKLLSSQSRNGSTVSTMCYSSVRASAEDKLRSAEYSPMHCGKKTEARPPGGVESSPDCSATTPYNTPAVSFLETKKRPLLDPSLAGGICESFSEEDENGTENSVHCDSRPPLQEAINRDLPTHQHSRSRSIKDADKGKDEKPVFIKLR